MTRIEKLQEQLKGVIIGFLLCSGCTWLGLALAQ